MRARVEQFFFTPANPSAIAALRIWVAALAALSFFAPSSATPSSLVQFSWLMQLYRDVILTPPYWVAAGAALTAFGSGLWSRPAGLLAAVLLAPLVPMQHALVGRYLLLFAVAALALLHSDRRWALRARLGFPQTSDVGPVWPVRLIQIQLSLLYFVNALAKSSAGYLSGGALAAMSMQLPNFQMQFSDGLFTAAGLAVPLWMAAVASASAKYCLAVGFWFPRLRWPTAVLGLAFHWALTWIVKIGLLDVVSVGLYAAFLIPAGVPPSIRRKATGTRP
jgi:hypothetical protein